MKTLIITQLISLISITVLAQTQFPEISGGGRFSIFLCDSNVYSCGSNQYGQLGDGTTADQWSPEQVAGITDVISIAAGHFHTLFLRPNGTVWASGGNFYGALGDGTTEDRHSPVQVSGIDNVLAISAGYHHSVFLKSDGTVWACGANYYGQLGDGTTIDRLQPVQINGLTGIVAISSFSGHNLFLKSNGTVMACGGNGGALGDGTALQRNSPVAVQGLSDVKAISAGAGHSLFLKNDGTVWGCGGNNGGQLGDGTFITRHIPVQMNGLSDVASISAGRGHSLFLRSDGSVWACGENDRGQLGNGDLTGQSQNVPFQIEGLTDVFSVFASWWYSMVIRNDGSVWGFGTNLQGELADGSQTGINQHSPVQSLYACEIRLGVEEGLRPQDQLLIFPNPATHTVRFQVPGSKLHVQSLAVTDMLGSTVLNLKPGTLNLELDISPLPTGIYTVSAQLIDGPVLRSRLVVQR
jgi:alpha-tubulin suppressor-like RCC1 family protein